MRKIKFTCNISMSKFYKSYKNHKLFFNICWYDKKKGICYDIYEVHRD